MVYFIRKMMSALMRFHDETNPEHVRGNWAGGNKKPRKRSGALSGFLRTFYYDSTSENARGVLCEKKWIKNEKAAVPVRRSGLVGRRGSLHQSFTTKLRPRKVAPSKPEVIASLVRGCRVGPATGAGTTGLWSGSQRMNFSAEVTWKGTSDAIVACCFKSLRISAFDTVRLMANSG